MQTTADESMRAAQRVLETALLCAQQALGLRDIDTLFAGSLERTQIESLLENIQRDWQDKGLELVPIASGWRFQSRPDVHVFLERLHPEKPQRYTRATLETLAIIAYRQPCTRGDMEDIRGVTISSHIIEQLKDRGWIEVIGHRETVGRPALYATTKQFLDDLGLAALTELPAIESPPEDAMERLHALAANANASSELSALLAREGVADLFSPITDNPDSADASSPELPSADLNPEATSNTPPAP